MECADTVKTNNFLFKSLQKVRLIPSEDVHCEKNAGKWLAVSSQLQIGVAVASGSHFIGFSTAELHKLASNKQNIDQEYTELKKKIVSFQQPSTIVSIGVNCDGTVLAAVVDTSNGPFVYIYDIRVFAPQYTGPSASSHGVRISKNPSAKSGCFEWNPAISDTFAASTDDNDMVVMKVDIMKLGNFSMIGEKKFESPVTVISWSPNGKQLTVGDILGKVTQCKPVLEDLEIVRCTMPLTDQPSPRVVGLFWLATTEWIVAYGYGPKEQEKVDMGILKIKEDEPPTWNPVKDLQYGMKNAVRSTHLYGYLGLFGEWNIVACASGKLCEIGIVAVGKDIENLQTWTVDENSRFDLPVCSNGKPSFPIGLAVDRSIQQAESLTHDGSQRCPAMSIVILLTSDGILSSYHAISAYPQHTSTSQALPMASSISVTTTLAPSHTVSTATQTTSSPAAELIESDKEGKNMEMDAQVISMLRAENEDLRRRLHGADEEYGTLFGVLEKKLRDQLSEEMAEMQATVDKERGRAIAFMTSSTLFEQQVKELKEETKARMQSMQRVILQMADKLDVSHIGYEKDFTKYFTQSLDDFFDSIIGSADTTGVGGEKQYMGQYPTFIGHDSTILPETFDKSRSLDHHPNDTFARGVAGELLAGIAGEPIGNSNVSSLPCSPDPRCRSTAYADNSVWESVTEADPEYIANVRMAPPVPEAWGLPPGLKKNISLVESGRHTSAERTAATTRQDQTVLVEMEKTAKVVDTEKVEETKKKAKTVTVKKSDGVLAKGRQPNASPRVKEWICKEAESHPDVWRVGVAREVRLISFSLMANQLNALPFCEIQRTGEDMLNLWKSLQRTVDKETVVFNVKRKELERQEGKSKETIRKEVQELMDSTVLAKHLLYYLRHLVEVDAAKLNPVDVKEN